MQISHSFFLLLSTLLSSSTPSEGPVRQPRISVQMLPCSYVYTLVPGHCQLNLTSTLSLDSLVPLALTLSAVHREHRLTLPACIQGVAP